MKIEDLKTEDLRFTEFETKESKNGGRFEIMKIFVERCDGRSRPLILTKKNVSTLGLKKILKEDGSISHYYFPHNLQGTRRGLGRQISRDSTLR